MKKVSLILTLIVLIGGAFVSLWVYQRYFKKADVVPVTAEVTRGDIVEQLRVRGDVAAEREYDLAFESFGTVSSVLVEEGQVVKAGDVLMRLDTTDFSLQLKRLFAQRLQAQAALETAQASLAEAQAARDASLARLDELTRGTLPETLNVQETKVAAARVMLANAEETTADAIRAAFTAADDAVRGTADQMFTNPRTSNPILVFLTKDSGLKTSLEAQRQNVEDILVAWEHDVAALTSANVSVSASRAQASLNAVASLLDTLSLALNGVLLSPEVTTTNISTWRAAVSATRVSVDAAIVVLRGSETQRRAAAASLAVAQDELAALRAGTSGEELAAQEALVRQADAAVAGARAGISQAQAAVAVVDADMDVTREKIRKATLVAPGAARVTKIWLKQAEQYQQSLQGMPAISLATIGIKVQSDVSELDIPKIRIGLPVQMTFDALPDRAFAGEVVSIEPKEVIKDGDTYFRVNFSLDQPTEDLRRGMRADLVVRISEKSGVLLLPVFLVDEREGKFFVTVLENGTKRETEVKTGISDGDAVEIIDGLREGQVVVAPAY